MKILLIDDDVNLGKVIGHQLKQRNYDVVTFSDGKAALSSFASENFDIVITDIQMPEISGIEILKKIRTYNSETVVIMITAYSSVDNAIEACRLGADDYISKPFGQEQLLFTIAKAVKLRRLEAENKELHTELTDKFKFNNMVAESGTMQEILKITRKVAESEATVLILGESGTGKELIAKAIHHNSPRKDKPFITINCPSIPGNLMESELFGHVKGAFTGALKDRKGKFEMADGGTVFLDEIGELPLELQSKLLRVLQEQEFEKVGDSNPIQVNVRIIAATNQNLWQLIRENKFREDLFYRLSVIPITLPPLRERGEDIPYLIEYFLHKYSPSGKLKIVPEALKILEDYSWPGNVRELQNSVERMVTLAHGKEIGIEDIPPHIRHDNVSDNPKTSAITEEGKSLEDIERQVIEETLKITGGNKSKAARLLKIERHILLYKLKKLEIGI